MSMKELIGAACVGLLCLAAIAVAQTAILQKLPDDIKLAAIPYAPGGEAGFLASDGSARTSCEGRENTAAYPSGYPDGNSAVGRIICRNRISGRSKPRNATASRIVHDRSRE